MVSLRVPPIFMPCTPSSQPAMTWRAPSENSKGSLRSLLESNLRSVGQPARVMHGNHLPGTGFGAFADNHFFDDKAAGRGDLTHCFRSRNVDG
jgi:hypothetical protein